MATTTKSDEERLAEEALARFEWAERKLRSAEVTAYLAQEALEKAQQAVKTAVQELGAACERIR